ncbi:MAG: bifunctional diguanylate cyclase/phosphodiesterase [Variovorax sp.]|nr:MAG: bifunctional diguanylate cyclase/phosphodiesterase [Variovorax sp.]
MPQREFAGHLKVCDGLILWADQHAHDLLDYPQGTLADMPVGEVLAADATLVPALLEVPALGTVDRLAVPLQTRTGELVRVNLHGEHMEDRCTLWTLRKVVGGLRRTRMDALAQRDALTGLPSRVPSLDVLLSDAERTPVAAGWLALCFLDIDAFREVNDRLGASGGDAVLHEVARRLRAALPPGARIARVGGDEFALVLWPAGEAQCRERVEQLLVHLAHPYRWKDDALTLHISCGVAMSPRGQQPTEVMLQQARQAVFMAKQAGQTIRFFDAAQALEERHEVGSRQRIRQGLERGEFVLAYQPKVDMLQGRVIGVEALVRWQHPERGLLQPGTFIPLVEDHEVVEQLGDWAMAEALRQAADWLSHGRSTSVSVNVSPRAFLRAGFAARLAGLLAQYPQLPPAVLELEILETTAIKDLDVAAQCIGECQALGVPVTLDDFGTGYSSLTYLRHLPATALKLDQTFVRGLLHSPDDRAIVEGILVMARGLGRRVIAEGVESVAHGEALLGLGCTLGQGYGIARPMDPCQVVEWIAAFERDPMWRSATATPAA